MKVWHLGLALVVAVSWGLFLTACGGSNDSSGGNKNIPFTPLPTPTVVPKLCGNGIINPGFEQCESDADCTAPKSCVCCLCLDDGEELGDRPFSLARPPSAFLSTGLAGGDVSTGTWLPGPLLIRAGRPDPDLAGELACSAPLRLQQTMPDGSEVDGAVFGFGIIDGSTLCNMIFAVPTEDEVSNSIDCDGGTAHGVEFTQNSNGPGEEDPPEIITGLGDPITAGPGAASLNLMRLVSIRIPFDASTPDRGPGDVCFDLDYEDPAKPEQVEMYGLADTDITDVPFALTTETGTTLVTNPLLTGGSTGTTPIEFSVTGQNLSCSGWAMEDSIGTLIGPLSGLDQVVGDTANAFSLTDKLREP